MHIKIGALGAVLLGIGGFWFWLGAPVPMPPSPLAAGEKINCVSYAPFREWQSPLAPGIQITREQIAGDLAILSRIARCVRTYSTEFGLDAVPEIASNYGLDVLLGLWLGRDAEKNRQEVARALAVAKANPQSVRAVVVGNEVLLRGEMSPQDLANTIRGVKAQLPKEIQVTYGDVWEFWLRHRELVDVVDFVTVHILPYWEDHPIPAEQAPAHIADIRVKVGESFPGKPILIGETGWPSAGRMREGALPSPVNQARVLHGVLALAKRENYAVNLIEAFDQPWKRQLEGTVGGHWGLFDARTRAAKFAWGEPVSNHPYWVWQAAAGMVLALAIMGGAFKNGGNRGRGLGRNLGRDELISLSMLALVGGCLLGWAAERIGIESLGLGDWIRLIAMTALAIAVPIVGAAAIVSGASIPSFAAVLGRKEDRPNDPLVLWLGGGLILLTVISILVALGLVFDPRYRDFPFAALSAATLPFVVLSLRDRAIGARGAAETTACWVLGLSAAYIVFNEGIVNWQAVWFSTVLAGVCFTLFRLTDAPGSK